MTLPPGVLDYFALEAADCLGRIRRWYESVAVDAAASPDDARRAARTLRGAAGVAREPEFAALGQALERLLGGDVGRATAGTRAVRLALDAAEEALAAPRPLPPGAVDRMRSATAAVEALGNGTEGDAPGPSALLDDANARVVPIRMLARDGDDGFLVRRAEAPPTTAGRRFRDASASLARTLRRLVGEARAATADGAAPSTLMQTLGADLRSAVADVRELAESYDVTPAASFFARREAGAAALESRTLDAVDAAAAGLLGERNEVAEPHAAPAAPAEASSDAPPPDDQQEGDAPRTDEWAGEATAELAPLGVAPAGTDFRPPTGEALVALLETGISGLGAIPAFENELEGSAPPRAPAPNAVSASGARATDAASNGAHPDSAADPDAPVPIGSLLYRGRAAVERAREVRDALRGRPGPPDPALLAELYDLLDLAAAD